MSPMNRPMRVLLQINIKIPNTSVTSRSGTATDNNIHLDNGFCKQHLYKQSPFHMLANLDSAICKYEYILSYLISNSHYVLIIDPHLIITYFPSFRCHLCFKKPSSFLLIGPANFCLVLLNKSSLRSRSFSQREASQRLLLSILFVTTVLTPNKP